MVKAKNILEYFKGRNFCE